MARESFLKQIWPPLPVWRRLDAAVFVVVVYTILVEWLYHAIDLKIPQWMGNMAVMNGIILTVLLGFRNREAYDRWWEARKLWGQLINDCRNLALKVQTLVTVPATERVAFGKLLCGFAVALRHHLRGGKPLTAVPGFEEEPVSQPHTPLQLAERVYRQLYQWRTANRLTEFDQLLLDPHARGLMDVCGACERIKSSPVPQSYRALLRHGTILYLLTAPWFMAGEYGYYSVPVVALLAYFLLGIELTAEDVEEPFGKDGDDLELNRYCETIQRSLEQVLGDLGLGNMALSTTLLKPLRE